MTPGPGQAIPDESREDHATTVRDSLSKNVIASTAAYGGYVVTRFFIPPFVLARITMEAYGLWSAAFILVAYIGISTMGLSGVYIKYIAEFSARREFDKANRLMSTGLCTALPACCAMFALVCWFWPRVVDWLKIAPSLRVDAREVVLSVLAVFLASMALSVFRDALSGIQRANLSQVVWIAGYLAETALIFTLVGMGRGIRGLAEAFVARTGIEIGLAIIMCYRTIPWLRLSPALFSKESLRIMFTFGGVVQVQSLLAVVLNSIERVLAAALVGLNATGLLELSEKLPNMSASVAMGFSGAFVPAASYLQGGLAGTPEQRETIQKLFLKGARYMNLAAAAICGFLALLAGPLLDTWVGKHFEGAAFLMIVFTVASQANLLTGPGTSILRGIGLPYEEFRYNIPNVVALAVFVPLSRVILGKWTVLGIGSAVAGATVVAAIYFVMHANRVMGIPARRYLSFVFLPGLMPYAVAALFAWPGLYADAHLGRWSAAAAIVGLGAVYMAILLVLISRFTLDKGERLWFAAIIRARLGRFAGVR